MPFAEAASALQHGAQTQQCRLIQPFADKLDPDRQLPGAEAIGTDNAGRPVRLNGDVAAITCIHETVWPFTTSSCAPCGVVVIGFTGVSSTSNRSKKSAKADLSFRTRSAKK